MDSEADPPRIRSAATGILLIGGIVSSVAAARILRGFGRLPSHPVLFYLAFTTTLLLGYAAGRLAGPWSLSPAVDEPARRVGPLSRLASIVLGCLCLILFVRYWKMRPAPHVAIPTFLAWGSSLAAGAAAFAMAGGRPTSRKRTVRIVSPWLLLLPVLLTAAAVRVVGLDRVPPIFAGDEASQVVDTLFLLHGDAASDPLGNGWGSAPRLGMLPAGWGATSTWGPIAGPRLPYAVAGALSVVAAAATAGLLAGGWAALGCAALLTFAPHHVHFSRIASVMILDSFFAPLALLFLVLARRSGRPLAGYLAGLSAGLALYGYFEGRAMALVFLMAFPVAVYRAPGSRRDRALLAFAGLAGFVLVAAPNLRFATQHWNEWNGRFNQTAIFSHDWWNASVALLGSPVRVLANQFVAGTLGLLSMYPNWSWYTGYPVVAPILLPAMALAGLGWLVGRQQLYAAAILALVALGNLASNVLTQGAPAPQRLSSLMPVLAILGGVAFASLLSVFPSRPAKRSTLRGVAGTLLVGGFLAWAWQPIGTWDPSPGYGGAPAALVTSSYTLLASPRYRGEAIYLHGGTQFDSSFPGIQYLLPDVRWTNISSEVADATSLPPGLHLFSPGFVRAGRRWKEKLQIPFAVEFADRAEPLSDVGYLLLVPAHATTTPSPADTLLEGAAASETTSAGPAVSGARQSGPARYSEEALTPSQKKALDGMLKAMATMTPEQRAAILELLKHPPSPGQ